MLIGVHARSYRIARAAASGERGASHVHTCYVREDGDQGIEVAEDTLADRIRAALAQAAVPVTEQRMFGGTCFMISGNMTACASKRGLLVRVGSDAQPMALARPHSRVMEMRGRVMAGYVFVSAEGVAGDADLRSWLELAQSYVSTLPPKVKKPPRRKPKDVPR